MKNGKKLILMSALAALFGAVGVGTLGAAAEVVNPGAPTTFAIERASTIRTESPFGIRFTATISASEHDALVAYAQSQDTTVEYGMLIIPEDLLGDETLDADDTNGTLRESYKEGTELDEIAGMKNNYEKVIVTPKLSADETTYTMVGGIKNLNANNVSREFAVRGYVLVDGTYYYTDSFQRSIYTAATYAIDSLDANSDVAKYLNAVVIDRVEAAYTQASVKITSDGRDFEYGLLHTGETFEMIGSVSNGKRTLESKATPVDMTNLKHVSRGVYEVKGFGNVSLTANVGATESVTDTALPVTTLASHERVWTPTADMDLNTVFMNKWGSATSPFQYVEEYKGKTDVLQYDSVAVKSSRWLFPDGFKPSAGNRFLFDIYWTSAFQIEIGFYYNGTNDHWSASSGWASGFYSDEDGKGAYTATLTNPVTKVEETVTVFEWRLLDQMGNEAGKSITSNYGKWMTLEFHFPENPDFNISLKNNIIGLYPTTYSENNYFANFRIQDYAMAPDVLVDFVPAEQLAEEYAQGDEIAFDFVYSDPIGRKSHAPATDFTLSGNAKMENNIATIGLLGDAIASYTLDEKIIEYTLVGPKQFTVNQANIKNGTYVDTTGGTATSSQKIELMDSFMGIENVVHIHGAGASTWALGFSDAEEKATATARYMYVQILVSQNWNFYTNVFDKVSTWSVSGSSAKEVTSADSASKMSLYKANGEEITVAANLNPGQASFQSYYTVGRWLTVEYKNFTLGGLNKAFMSGLGSYGTGMRNIYIKSVVFSTERLAEEHVTVNDNGTPDDTSDDTTTTTYTVEKITSTDPRVAAGGTLDLLETPGLYLDSRWQGHNTLHKTTFGDEEVYEWKYIEETMTDGVVTAVSRHYTESKGVQTSYGQLRFSAFMINSVKFKGTSYYMYMDIYIEDTSNLPFNLASTFGWDNTNHIQTLYNEEKVSTTYATITCYDKDGNKLANTNLNNFKNQWVTVQFKFNSNTTAQGANGFYIKNIEDLWTARKADLTNSYSIPHVYLRSMELTTTKRF